MRNVKLAFRTLFRSPFVTAVAALSLALGIGANAAIFSLTDQVLMRPLPVAEPGRLVNVGGSEPDPEFRSCNVAGCGDEVFSYPMFRDLEQRQTVLTGLAAHVMLAANYSVHGEPLAGDAMLVSGSYFSTLGLTPAAGRLIGPEDDAAPGAGQVVVLGYGFWRAHFAGSDSAVGQTMRVNGRTLTIIGVAPKGFEGTTFGIQPTAFVPITMAAALGAWAPYQERRAYWVYLFGRLKPGVSIEQARAALNAIYRPILSDVEAPLQQGMSEPTLAKFKSKVISLTPGYRGQSSMQSEAKTPLVMLFGVTAVVLLIACANIANLLLARGAGRATEMKVRLALGARRRHLLGQLLTEAVILAGMGGVLSLLVAQLTLNLLASLLPPATAGSIVFSLQPAVIGFTAVVALVTGLLFGLYPAIHATRADLISAIRAGAGQISGQRGAGRFRSALVSVQVALATALLISAGLFLKSLVNVARVDLGVQVDEMVTFRLSPERSGYDSTRSAQLFQQVEDELAKLPGVSAVTASAVPLLARQNRARGVKVQGFASGPDIDDGSHYNLIEPGYFQTLGIPVIQGREFTGSDTRGAPPVAIVNQAFARKFHLGGDALHKFMSRSVADSLNVEIVGVVRDAKYSSVKNDIPPQFFMPWRQWGGVGTLTFYAKSRLPAERQLPAIAQLLKRVAPEVPTENLMTMPQQIRDNVFLDRLISILSAGFAALATLLAAVGLYGVLAYTVQQRTREFGVRMALGANARSIGGLVFGQVGVLAAIGGACGVAAALGLGRLLQSLLYQMKGYDPAVLVASLVLLGGVAFAASWVPVRRASRVDPVNALRYD